MPNSQKKIYFASDAHLGYPNLHEARWREDVFVAWLDSIKSDAAELYLVGDIFDFWFEYKSVVPKGFVRLLGKLAEFVDSGIPIHFFTGNHDVWAFSYLHDEIGCTLHFGPVEAELMGKRFLIAHGDGLGPDTWSYKLLKRLFTSKFLQFMFACLHPNWAMWFGHKWSNHSRGRKGLAPFPYKGDDQEYTYVYSMQVLEQKSIDYFVYGHRHLMIQKNLPNKSNYIVLGDWVYNFSYGVFDGQTFELKTIQNEMIEKYKAKQKTELL